jgi:NADPH:quinone reductase-like Zn-dependent oxidoreductase
MKATRILQFGPPSVILNTDTVSPEPREGELLVRVKAAGVGPWDALIREGKSAIPQLLPLTLGSDLSGTVESIGAGVSGFQIGEAIYGATNQQFTGAYAEYALAAAGMVARKPTVLSFIEAASAPVVAVTAWQMLFDYARVISGQTVLVHGAGGNVGAYAVQLAKHAGLHVIATAAARDVEYVRSLGAEKVVNYQTTRFEDVVGSVDVVIDTVGGETRERSFRLVKRGGILVSAVSPVPAETPKRLGIRAVFFLVEVTTARLNALTELFESGELVPHVGTVLPLEAARTAHEMLAGVPHNPGKIVLKIAA